MRVPRRLVRALRLMDHTIAVVVFTVPEKRLREMDVATGPCVATGGRKRALAGASRQDGGEFPKHASALFTALTGRSADNVLTLLAEQEQGRLFVADPNFLDAMAEAHERLQALQKADLARGDAELTTWWAEREALDQAWLAAADWPRSVTSTSHRLDRLHWAHAARERGQHLYIWHGPGVLRFDAVRTDTVSG